VDAIYCLRKKALGKTQSKHFRYQQIFEDFGLDEEENLISSCLIIANYTKEMELEEGSEKLKKRELRSDSLLDLEGFSGLTLLE